MSYYNSKSVGLSFEQAIEKVTEELKKEGFGVLTEIDVQATLKKKLDVDFRKYKILGACNPQFAFKALQAEEHIGVLLPCNFIVQEKAEGGVQVSAVNPLESMKAVGNVELASIAEEVAQRITRVLQNL
ncbi:MAG: DUF302 domain-containing protein [Ignavibacteriaceae bacterium]|jgi:uncharacterized protein (DUF302 family)|nr:DUF302 domain-containing protein [Ignavibacteriaceae bacterium]